MTFRPRLALLAVILLAACAAPPEPEPVVDDAPLILDTPLEGRECTSGDGIGGTGCPQVF